MARWYHSRLLVLAIVWVCSAAYLPGFVERGWIPHDEGAFAHSAERVLAGELPHRDFDEIYTGGLSYLHALGFELFGVRLTSIRIVLLAFTLAFVPALYAIAVRFVTPPVAGLLTLLGVAWSVPNYFAGVPSWYNLFFATFGTLALLRHVETGGGSWLFLAGLCGGLSLLVKITGVYFVAAALLFLLYREHWLARAAASAGKDDGRRRTDARPSRVLAAVEAAGGLVLLGALVVLGPRLGVMELVHFVLPAAALAALVTWTEATHGTGSLATRARGVLRLLGPFLLGVALPVLIFALPYVASGAVADLVRGLFVLPARRMESATFPLPPPLTLLAALPYAALLFWSPALSARVDRTLAVILALALAAVLAAAGTYPEVYKAVWYTLRPLVPVAVSIGCFLLARPAPGAARDGEAAQKLFLLVAVASLVSLVQFPYSFAVYFFYAAPLVAIAIAAVVTARQGARLVHLAVLGFYLSFALLWLNTSYVRSVGLRYIADGQASRLALDRATLLVWEDRKREYERLIAVVRQHAATPYVYAAPDAPEVYFLSGLHNPTRTIYDIFDEPAGRVERILRALDAHDVRVVVIFSKPEFSPPLAPALSDGLARRFPHWEQVGRFQVGWRN